MVTVAVELDDETVRALSQEAAQFEFRGSESYVRWLLDHRGLVLAESDEMTDRLSTLEARLRDLEGESEEVRVTPVDDDAAGEAVRDVIDEWLVMAQGADDDEIEQAVATVERRSERASPSPVEKGQHGNGETPAEFVDETLREEFER